MFPRRALIAAAFSRRFFFRLRLYCFQFYASTILRSAVGSRAVASATRLGAGTDLTVFWAVGQNTGSLLHLSENLD